MDRLQRAVGVTRVARVTGLDRSGVEVACAVRPAGHVLQVSNGKGERWEEARASALSEAAELWAAERPPLHELVFGSFAGLRRLGAVWPPRDLAAPRLWSADTRIAWVRARQLGSGAPVLVPAQQVYCPPPGGPPLGPAVARWSSNGLGAHPRPAAALRHALLEALERDRVARVLPRGFTPRFLARRKLDARRLPLWVRLRDRGFEGHLFELPGPLPAIAAVLVDLEEGPVPVTAGYACALTPARAARAALLEAAQSRLTDVHGAREDVSPVDRGEARALRAACEQARPLRSLRELPQARRLPPLRAAIVTLRRTPITVVKVIAPDLRLPVQL